MDIQSTLLELAPYNINFNIYNGNVVVGITYPEKWSVNKPDNKDIVFDKDVQSSNVYYYCAPLSVDMQIIFDYIEATIQYNKELDLKIELYKEKIKELQDIFQEESLDVLKTLSFQLKKPKMKKKSVQPSLSTATDIITETIENDDDNNS